MDTFLAVHRLAASPAASAGCPRWGPAPSDTLSVRLQGRFWPKAQLMAEPRGPQPACSWSRWFVACGKDQLFLISADRTPSAHMEEI